MTFNKTNSDSSPALAAELDKSEVGDVIKLSPIASVAVGEPLNVRGIAELKDDAVVIISTISGPPDLSSCIVNQTGEAPYVTLLKNHEYRYVIKTGSYPQIIHEPGKDVTGGTITCTSFVDANGKTYTDWIPAIRLGE